MGRHAETDCETCSSFRSAALVGMILESLAAEAGPKFCKCRSGLCPQHLIKRRHPELYKARAQLTGVAHSEQTANCTLQLTSKIAQGRPSSPKAKTQHLSSLQYDSLKSRDPLPYCHWPGREGAGAQAWRRCVSLSICPEFPLSLLRAQSDGWETHHVGRNPFEEWGRE